MKRQLVDAWAAGIVDGEGCITVKKNGKYYFLTVIVGQSGDTLPPMIRKLKAYYGGNVGTPYKEGRGARRPKWYWQVVCETAENFLRTINPYLVEKRKQAALAIRYRNCVGRPGTRRSDKERASAERFYLLLRAEKRYVKSHPKWSIKDV